MKKYLYIIYTYLKKRAIYKFDILLGYLFAVILAVTAKYFWQNLAISGKIPQNELFSYISYSALTAAMGVLFGGEIISSFGEKIRDGSVISDLQKPLPFQLYTMAGNFGTMLGNLLFNILPKFFAMILLIGIYIPAKPINVLLFLVSLILGCLIMVAIDFIFSIFAIYFVEVISLIILKHMTIGLCAGAVIPLWIFPDKFLQIINFLPFRLICYVPISIYLEKISLMDAVSSLLLQIFWLIALFVIGKVIAHFILKRITVAGG